jgi:hypothetical protein
MDEQDLAYLRRQRGPGEPMRAAPERVGYAREFYALEEENTGSEDARARVIAERGWLAGKLAELTGSGHV